MSKDNGKSFRSNGQIYHQDSLHVIHANIEQKLIQQSIFRSDSDDEVQQAFISDLTLSQKLALFNSNAGVLRGEWRNDKGKLETICFGTAFAISHRIIISCAHSIFLQKKRKACTSFTFVHNINNGKITSSQSIYKGSEINFLEYEPLKIGQSYEKYPVREDIVLLYLERSLPMSIYPQIGLQTLNMVDIGTTLSIQGYPSQKFYQCVNIFDAKFEKVSLDGQLLEIKENVIYHNLKTWVGHSGSAIIGCDINEQPAVIGVHTHKGLRKNSGVYLSNEAINKLIAYEINFALAHEQYKLSIKFPPRIRSQFLATLDQETLEKILPFQELNELILPYNQQMSNNKNLKPTISDRIQEYHNLKSYTEYNFKSSVKNKQSWRNHFDEKIQKISKLIELNNQNISEEKGLREPYNLFQVYLKVNNQILATFEQVYCSIRQNYDQNYGQVKSYYEKFIDFQQTISKSVCLIQERQIPEFRMVFQPISKFSTVQIHLNNSYNEQIVSKHCQYPSQLASDMDNFFPCDSDEYNNYLREVLQNIQSYSEAALPEPIKTDDMYL